MLSHFRTVLSIAVAGSALLVGTTPATGQSSTPAGALRTVAAGDVDAIFSNFNSAAAPGCTIAVDRNGRTVLSRAYGMADLEHDIRNSAETVFEAGSVSKQFTAAAVLTLVDAGHLTLDTDVRSIIPELPNYGRVITIDRLLNHTSGLRDWGSVAALSGWPRTTRIHTQRDALNIIVKQRALNFEPGVESSYTNTGYNLLTEIVERVSGQSLAAFTQQTFFKPLGMTRSQWRDDFRRIVPGRAQAYQWRDGRFEQEMPFENVYGNGGLLTTVGDLLIWNRALDSGKLGAFVTTKLSERSVLNDGRKLTYGRGLFNHKFNGTEEIAHSGSTAGYRAWLGRYPAYQLSVALLCNASNADTGMGRKVAALYLPGLPESRAPGKALNGLFVDQASGTPLDPAHFSANDSSIVSKDRVELIGRDNNVTVYLRAPAVDTATVDLDEFAGTYASDEVGATYVIAPAAGGLTLRIRDRPDFVQTLKPVYRDAFQGQSGTLRFVRDSANRITALTISVERARNVRFDRVG